MQKNEKPPVRQRSKKAKQKADVGEPIEIKIPLGAVGYLFILIVSVAFLYMGIHFCALGSKNGAETEFFTARVEQVGKADLSGSDAEVLNKSIPFSAKITGGTLKGRSVDAVQDINSLVSTNFREVSAGDQIVVAQLRDESGGIFWKYSSHSRLFWLGSLCGGFLLCVVLLGGKKGVKTTLSLIMTVTAVFGMYIPGILKGFNIYALTAIVSLYIILMTLAVLNGGSKKTVAAVVGNILGLILSGFLAWLMTRLLQLSGLTDPDYIFLLYLNPDNPINLQAILWGAVVIGSLGAVMDVAMTIASALQELVNRLPEVDFLTLFKSGMNIGRDAIGTMTNTLILAYVGSSLAMVLLYTAYNKNPLHLLNTESIAGEIMQAVAGSMGILFSVPATAFVAAFLYSGGRFRSEF